MAKLAKSVRIVPIQLIWLYWADLAGLANLAEFLAFRGALSGAIFISDANGLLVNNEKKPLAIRPISVYKARLINDKDRYYYG